MAALRCVDVQARPTEFLEVTSLTRDEFQPLVPPFEAAFHAHMAAWRLDGTPRTARRFRVYHNCPLPPPADRWFFRLTYLQTYSLQVVQGRLCGMGQSTAHPWIHVLFPALQAALRTLGDTPARSLTTLAPRRGVTESDAAAVVTPLAEEPPPGAAVPASPLLPMTGRNGGSSAPKTLRHRKRVIAARTRTTREKMSCGSMPHSPSSSCVRPTADACTSSALPRPRPLRYPRGVGCCRTWASWPSRGPKSRAACPRSNPAVRH
jgi:hypothetical protein